MIVKVAYGYQVGENDDYIVRIIEEAFEGINALRSPGEFLVELFPFRMRLFIYHSGDSHVDVCLCLHLVRFVPSWFPLAGFKRRAKAEKKRIGRLETVPFEWAMNNIVSIRVYRLAFRIQISTSGHWKFRRFIRFKAFFERKRANHRPCRERIH